RPPLAEVAPRATAFFGELEAKAAVPIEAVVLSKPRVELPAALQEFGTAQREPRLRHTWGRGYPDRVRGFRGDFSAAPDLVVTPRTEAEVALALEVCEQQRLTVTPYGGGSSVVRGVEPVLGPGHRGTVSLDLGALDRVLEVDATSRLARIQGGVFGPALEQQLAVHGLTLRHFPQSFEFSTLGGWIATRAGGHFATLYTHIDELVHAARMVTPRGLWASQSFPASGAGSDPNRWVCGSEGTLGVITEAWMRVLPRPTFRASASVHFERFEAAVGATREISQSGLYPANCRLLDPQEALVHGVAGDGGSVLLLAFESADHPLGPWLDRAVAIAQSHGGTCPKGKLVRDEQSGERGADAGESWRAAFLQGPYLQDAMIQLGVIADTFETACTWTAFARLYGEVGAAMQAALEQVCGGGVVTCRFTHVYPDGPAPYFTFIGKARRGAELEQWAQLKAAASDALQKWGGTITHHHAVGRTHRPWYDRERPEPFAQALGAARRAVDPAGILNPGVLTG
ncbi:MAG: putative alkyl dihydroxyacetonephosphate synthase agp, partial [Myxococcaceae bacterium]|nr:putative alkyl dihydroxyacetonephosphate synthase agp [Myxococcaceae bacterium]